MAAIPFYETNEYSAFLRGEDAYIIRNSDKACAYFSPGVERDDFVNSIVSCAKGKFGDAGAAFNSYCSGFTDRMDAYAEFTRIESMISGA
jgi:hypothetical protein